jgi:hypothetical protein
VAAHAVNCISTQHQLTFDRPPPHRHITQLEAQSPHTYAQIQTSIDPWRRESHKIPEGLQGLRSSVNSSTRHCKRARIRRLAGGKLDDLGSTSSCSKREHVCPLFYSLGGGLACSMTSIGVNACDDGVGLPAARLLHELVLHLCNVLEAVQWHDPA